MTALSIACFVDSLNLQQQHKHVNKNIKKFYQSLRLRGYPSEFPITVFTKAMKKLEHNPPERILTWTTPSFYI